MLICFFLRLEIKKKPIHLSLIRNVHENRKITNESLDREINFDESRPVFMFSVRDR